ncbi:MAG TPA: hypothetical protein VM432_01280, partial [Bdellovibrionales bacterium]|nr:hypothetical protein [Bdellovibrionales bacterium]
MGFNFKVKKDQQPDGTAAPENPGAAAETVVDQSGDFRLDSKIHIEPTPEPITPEDGSTTQEVAPEPYAPQQETSELPERTVIMPKEMSFLEKSKLTGIAPPPLSGTSTGLLLADAKRSQQIAFVGKALGVLAVPAIAGGVFFFLTGQGETPAPAPHVAVAKNPNKNPNRNPATKPATPESPTENPQAVDVSQAAPAATNAATPPPLVVPPGTFPDAPKDGNSISQALALMSIGRNIRHEPRPLIRLSIQPTSQQSLVVGRDSAAMILTRQEYQLLTRWIDQDVSAKFFFDEWIRSSRDALPYNHAAVSQFKLESPGDRDIAGLALADLDRLRALHLGVLVTGESALINKLRSTVLAWAKTYQPMGDAIADSALEPVFEAYGTYGRSFVPEEKAKIE